jgi:protease YdgD
MTRVKNPLVNNVRFLPAALVFIGLAALDASCPPATASVFGPDQRVPLPETMHQTGTKLGVFFDSRSQSVCTAFCVAPDVVATAAHCLYRTSGEQPLRLSDLSFKLHGTTKSVRVAGAKEGAPEANVTAGSDHLNIRPPIDATHDWALVRLSENACSSGVFKVSAKPVDEIMKLAEKGRVFNIAYHRDLPKWQPMLNTGCNVKRNFIDADWATIKRDFSDPDQLLLHTCDTGAASSGSPLLIDGSEGPEVVGINVGTYVQSKVIMLNGEVLHRFKSDDVANTGVNALAFSAQLADFLTADTLTSRNEIRLLQDALAGHALYAGPRDGRYGLPLKVAIERYQRAAQMPITGFATLQVLQALTGESQVVTGKISGARTTAATGPH